MKRFLYILIAILFIPSLCFAGSMGNPLDTTTLSSDVITTGTISGLCQVYVDGDTITLGAGYLEANGKYYKLSTATNFDIDVFDNGGFTYGYIDDSESSYPVITLDWSATEPVWSDSLHGEYNGNDRCIIKLYCDAADAIEEFTATSNGRIVSIEKGVGLDIATAMDPDGAWDTPNDFECSLKVPIGATEVSVRLRCGDATAGCFATVANYEISATASATAYSIGGYDSCWGIVDVGLGVSRNIRIAGSTSDDAALGCRILRYKYKR